MSDASSNISTVQRLAKRLEDDIRRRALKTGDKYLKAQEAARMLGVSQATAQRAMKVLGDSQTLVRRRSVGTFVGPGAVNPSLSRVSTVCILAPDSVHSTIQAMAGWMLAGLRRESGCTNVNFGFVPKKDDLEYVKQLIRSTKTSAELVGFVAIGCRSELYQVLAESSIPTLVFGSLFQDTRLLSSIDFDNRQAARLMTRYLVGRGHKRMMLLTTTEGLPGDHDFVDGVSDVLTEAGLPANALALRILSEDPKSALRAVRQLLRADNRPSSLIVRGAPVIDTVDSVLSDMGLKTPDELEIVYQSVAAESKRSPRHPHIVPQSEMDEIGRTLGRLLRQRMDAPDQTSGQKVVIPVKLRTEAGRDQHLDCRTDVDAP
jgi:DNA-binding LacI/PurR family transcriptional regulator